MTIHIQARCPDEGFEFILNVCINQRKATSYSVISFKPTFHVLTLSMNYFCLSTKPCYTSQPSRGGGGCSFHMSGLILLFAVEWKKVSCMKWLWHTQYHTVALCMWILSEATRPPRSKRIVTDSFICSINGKMHFKPQNRTVLPEGLICGHTEHVCTTLLVHANKKAEKGSGLLELLCSTSMLKPWMLN